MIKPRDAATCAKILCCTFKGAASGGNLFIYHEFHALRERLIDMVQGMPVASQSLFISKTPWLKPEGEKHVETTWLEFMNNCEQAANQAHDEAEERGLGDYIRAPLGFVANHIERHIIPWLNCQNNATLNFLNDMGRFLKTIEFTQDEFKEFKNKPLISTKEEFDLLEEANELAQRIVASIDDVASETSDRFIAVLLDSESPMPETWPDIIVILKDTLKTMPQNEELSPIAESLDLFESFYQTLPNKMKDFLDDYCVKFNVFATIIVDITKTQIDEDLEPSISLNTTVPSPT